MKAIKFVIGLVLLAIMPNLFAASSIPTINGTTPAAELDLQVVTATDGIFSPGDEITIGIQIENTGNAASSGYQVVFYASANATITDDDVEIGDRDRLSLPAGDTDIFATTTTIPLNLADGDYYIGAIVNFTDGDDDNNIGSDNNTITVVTVPESDLELIEVNAFGNTFAQGASINISTTVENKGTAASEEFDVDFYLSVNDGISTSDIFIGTTTRGGLAPDETSTESAVAMIPMDLAPGVYFVGAIIEIFHDNSSNNDDNDPNPITVVEPGTNIFDINSGHNGSWWGGPSRSGEGVQLELVEGSNDSVVMIATIYSYDTDGNQIFLIAIGTVQGDSAILDVFITEGGMWGPDFDPAMVNETQWGSGVISASSCETMLLDLKPNTTYQDMGYTDLTYDLIRLAVPLAPCPAVSVSSQ